MRYEREQMRNANGRMQALLERLRAKMSQQDASGATPVTEIGAAMAALRDHEELTYGAEPSSASRAESSGRSGRAETRSRREARDVWSGGTRAG